MSTLAYMVAYLGILVFLAIVVGKTVGYLKRPLHVRWELYPVAHEESERVAYGGSYLEDSGWWEKKQKASLWGSIKGILVEFSVLHSTWTNNRPLWYRTYPFHLGLYLLVGTVCLAVFAALLAMLGVTGGVFMRLLNGLGGITSLLSFVLVAFGASALIHRRLSEEDLRNYSTPEHFFNLGAFLLLAVLGLVAWAATPYFFAQLAAFVYSLLTFSFAPMSLLFALFVIVMFALMAYVPATHMAHFFMKYFLYHDIRWGDQPTQDNPATQRKINAVLGYQVAWKARHVGSDGSKTWAEVATTNPTTPKE